MFGIGTTEMLLILVVILLLFGASRIPQVMGGLGKGIREFKKGIREGDDAAEASGSDTVARELKSRVGAPVRLLPDGTLEVGVSGGATLVEVDQGWAVLKTDDHTDKVPLVQVKRIVIRT
ncbi:twin-arginine translocase TatA/TatE family subunit [Myxococcota bacterium]|jgi:sec-independent protein translocase protein TatA|nr:twin-arginine translocase TatA/TatE family subunit [Myxococcota bacterium]